MKSLIIATIASDYESAFTSLMKGYSEAILHVIKFMFFIITFTTILKFALNIVVKLIDSDTNKPKAAVTGVSRSAKYLPDMITATNELFFSLARTIKIKEQLDLKNKIEDSPYKMYLPKIYETRRQLEAVNKENFDLSDNIKFNLKKIKQLILVFDHKKSIDDTSRAAELLPYLDKILTDINSECEFIVEDARQRKELEFKNKIDFF